MCVCDGRGVNTKIEGVELSMLLVDKLKELNKEDWAEI